MVVIPLGDVLQFKVFPLLFHELDKVGPVDQLKMPDPPVLVPMFGTVFGIDILTGINLYLELMGASLESAVHHHGYHFGVAVLEGLILYVDILRLRPFSDSVAVLAMLRAVFRNVNAEKDLAAPRVETLFFAKFLSTPGLGKLHSKCVSSGFRLERK
jgi:hypothetical protein